MNNNNNIKIDEKKVNLITKKVVALERQNLVNMQYNRNQICDEIKNIIKLTIERG